MRRILVSLVALSLVAVIATPAAADPTSICPDGMVLLPATLVQNGAAKDKNDNRLLCGKYEDGGLKGGPDDSADDILI